MINWSIFDDYKKDFLNINHSNIRDLLEDISSFHELLLSDSKENISDSIKNKWKSKKEILKWLSKAFQTIPDWNNPKVAYNIIPSPMISTVSLNALIQLYNPNAILDELSWWFVDCEKSVVKILSDLIWRNREKSLWISTFWGKWTLLYPIKIWINKCCPDSVQNWVDSNIVVLTWVNNHYSITDICNFLWIGTKNCIRVKWIKWWWMDLRDLEWKMKDCIENNKKIACIIASGGETINHWMDDIKEIYDIREKLVKKYNLSYKPHLHSDSVNGRIRLFFRKYDIKRNKLWIEKNILSAIEYNVNIMKSVLFADSYAVDFHKTWLCPYVSAFFIVKDKYDLVTISEINSSSHNAWLIGDILPCNYTLEHSRSCTGIWSAYFILHYLWVEWFQKYIISLLRVGFYIRNLINDQYSDHFEVLNNWSFWISSVIIMKFSQINICFQKLLVSSKEQKDIYNNLSMKLLSKINMRRKKWESKLYIGYIANHNYNGKNTDIHAFKIYPTSLHYTEENVINLLDELVWIKNQIKEWSWDLNNLKESDIYILR